MKREILRRENSLFLLVLLLIIFFLYFRSFNFDYIWDSKIQVENNKLIRDSKNPFQAFKYGYWQAAGFNKGPNDYYRPLTIASLILNRIILGNKPFSYRLVNLIIFYLSLIVLFFYLKRVDSEKYFAEVMILLFAVFPLHIDNIVWVVGRCDLLMLLFGFISILFFEIYIQEGKKYAFVLSVFSFLLGIFSKEASLFVFPFLILYEVIRRRKITVFYHFSNLVMVILFFYVKFSVNGVGGIKFSLFSPFYKNFLILLGSIGYYFKSMILPFDFVMFVSATSILRINYYIWGFLFITFYLFLLYLFLRKNKDFGVPLLFITVFFPAYLVFVFSNLFPYSLSTRYIILPFLGFLWIIVKSILKLENRLKEIFIVFLIIVYGFSILINSSFYKNEELFWSKLVKKQPEVAFINAEYARSLILKGEYIKAEKYLEKVLKLRMKEYTAVLTGVLFANLYIKKAEYSKALKWLKTIEKLHLDRHSERDLLFLKVKIAKYTGDFKKAEEILKNAISRFEDNKIFKEELYKLYLCFDKDEKVKEISKFDKSNLSLGFIMKKNSLKNIEMIKFYVKCGNFKKAIFLMEKDSSKKKSIKELFSLAEFYYRLGQEKKGDEFIKRIYKRGKNNYIILNAIGYFYVKRVLRERKAVEFFILSLIIKRDQQDILNFIKRIED